MNSTASGVKRVITSDDEFDVLDLEVVVPEPEGGEVSIWVFHFLFLLLVHVSYIFEQ